MAVKTKWIIAVVVTLMPAAAYTYTLLSPLRHWTSLPVTICVKTPGHVSIADGDGGVAATIGAINSQDAWNGTIRGVVDATNDCATQAWQLGDGQPTIALGEVVKGACSGSCLAVTFVGYYDCDPLVNGFCAIVDADVQTRKNRADKWGGPYYSLSETGGCTAGREWNIESIMVHEVGHVLGIGHTDVAGATMYPSISSCNDSKRQIAQDDKDALDALY